MGLDIYAGTLTRYYARNWKTSVQQWGEANGVNVNVVRNEPDDVQIAPPEEILAGVTGWKEQFLAVYGQHITEPLVWNEDNDVTPYYTDKPDWCAMEALFLYIACKYMRKEVPKMVKKNFSVFDEPVYKDFKQSERGVFSLTDGAGLWLPIRDAFMVDSCLPTGQEKTFGTLGMLKSELIEINAIEWKADEETILKWNTEEGYPTDALYRNGKITNVAKNEEYDTVSLAKFAFSILWQAVKHAEEHGTLIIFDY